jgi:signal peptidase I
MPSLKRQIISAVVFALFSFGQVSAVPPGSETPKPSIGDRIIAKATKCLEGFFFDSIQVL